MANVKWSYQLKKGQSGNPIVYSEMVDLPKFIPFPKESSLLKFFPTKNYTLQTWGREIDDNGKTVLINDPHWIAVRKGTPIHFDPKYPRYSHHLKVRVDDGVYCRGLSKEELHLKTGLFYILDTHSPHQVFHKHKYGVWNVAASIDSHEILNYEDTKLRLLKFVTENRIDDENLSK